MSRLAPLHPGALLWRLALVGAVSVCVTLALMPKPPLLPGNPSDVLLHAAAFISLALASRLAFPYARAATIILALLALGAGIECAQAWPLLGRDASLQDLAVDVIAATIGLIFIDAVLSLKSGRAKVS
jgi:hypothetical protein